jgi:hypothetical protein
MRRFLWSWPVLLLFGCHRSAVIPVLLPETVAGVWHRATLEHPPVSDAPDPVPRSAVDQFQLATYEGPGKLSARVYVLDSPAVALELTQRWRPSADTVFFNVGRYFVVLKWQDADRKAVHAFATELEMRLGPA